MCPQMKLNARQVEIAKPKDEERGFTPFNHLNALRIMS